MRANKEEGFSYIEVMIAIVMLMIGILGMMSAMTAAIVQSRGQDQQLNSKQIAGSTMESIMSVKETDSTRLGWDRLGNVCPSPCQTSTPLGIFPTGFQPVKTDAGPDEIIGTADDTGTVLLGLQRRIVITDLCDPERPSYNCNPPGILPVKIRQVEVTLNYNVGNLTRREVVKTVLTNYELEQ